MSDHVSWVLSMSIKDGKSDAFHALAAEMVEATKAESGALVYQYFVADDGVSMHVLELYESSEAVMVHMASFGANFAERFFDALDPVGVTIYGDPSDDVKAAFADFGPTYMSETAGFVRGG